MILIVAVDLLLEYIKAVPLMISLISKYIPNFYCHISPSGIVSPSQTLPFSAGSLKEKSFNDIWSYLKHCHKNKKYPACRDWNNLS